MINKTSSNGFTIVELLVVIVVIAILAAITIVAYTGISGKAVVSSVQSDLANAKKQLSLYYVDHGSYPTNLDVNKCPTGSAPSPDTKYCLKPSGSNTFDYAVTPTGSTNPQAFRLTSTSSSTIYAVTNSTQPAVITTTASCPTGFIPVPGSGTYGTNDFCVMKYTASQVGATTTPISQAGSLPWVNISQTTAIANSSNVANCTGCHLISEAEWLTIAQNVLTVASNWNTNTVGSGYIYSGHNDNAPANALVADSSDANGYAGETNTGGNQRRTLTLTNGSVIWDLAGNNHEWTLGTSTTGVPGVIGAGSSWREWTAITYPGALSPNPFPATTGISGAINWNSSNGIGGILSNANASTLFGFVRGGYYGNASNAGLLALVINNPPGTTYAFVGFRVSR